MEPYFIISLNDNDKFDLIYIDKSGPRHYAYPVVTDLSYLSALRLSRTKIKTSSKELIDQHDQLSLKKKLRQLKEDYPDAFNDAAKEVIAETETE